MDYNVAFWTTDLDRYITAQHTILGKYATYLKWTSDDGNDYYSMLVNPCGIVVLEIIGDKISD